MRVLIFGDICPTKDNLAWFKSGNVDSIFGDVLPMMRESDFVMGNLECAITDRPVAIQKAGPVLHAPIASVSTLRKAGFNLMSLANNHIRDCGNEGVMTTIASCREQGIDIVGAGSNYEEAKHPYLIEACGKKIAVVAFAEHEFNYATKDRAGAATLDVYEDFDQLRVIRQQVDTLIVFYHGGIEYHPYPSPLLAKKCRKFVDCGADVVLCQHSHCVGTVEHYNGRTIVYGQGNSVFGYRKGDEGWNTGMIVEVKLNGTGTNVKCHFIETIEGGAIRLMPNDKAGIWHQTLFEREREIAREEFIEQKWCQFCQRLAPLNVPLLLGWRRVPIAINRRIGNNLVRLCYRRRKANVTHNLIRCEAHYEVMDTIFQFHDWE